MLRFTVIASTLAFVSLTTAAPAPRIRRDVNPDDGEGHDLLVTPDQFKRMRPGSLTPITGACAATKAASTAFATTAECIDWCINTETDTSKDTGACQYNTATDECTVFTAESFDGTTTASDNTQCFSLLASDRRSKRGLVVDTLLWPNNEVIYEIVPSSDANSWATKLGGESHQTSALVYIQRAFDEYHTKTNVRFVQRTSQAHYIKIGYFGGGCSSYVGKNNFGAQAVTLGWCRSSFGSIVHELGHSAGMWHEHTRADRGNYLTVSDGANGNFNIARTDSRGIVYDFGSIM